MWMARSSYFPALLIMLVFVSQAIDEFIYILIIMKNLLVDS